MLMYKIIIGEKSAMAELKENNSSVYLLVENQENLCHLLW